MGQVGDLHPGIWGQCGPTQGSQVTGYSLATQRAGCTQLMRRGFQSPGCPALCAPSRCRGAGCLVVLGAQGLPWGWTGWAGFLGEVAPYSCRRNLGPQHRREGSCIPLSKPHL